ncbi:hypothetical protein R1flu_021988 [Riccia fluitans]|uniref:Smr domain-containing protein n=1 Tax=Riccia fluitans TaxID=41844 RepID=A0ABD1ZR96_9MARC
MSGISFQSAFGEGVDLMACDGEWRQGGWLHHGSIPPISQRVEQREEESDIEGETLSLLLKVFPSMSLTKIAEAYTRAEGDPDYAAELLATGSQSSPLPAERNTVQQIVSDNGVFGTSKNQPLQSAFHFEKRSEQFYGVETQNLGPVGAQEAPGVYNHSGRPPEMNSSGPFGTSEWGSQPAGQPKVTNGRTFANNGRNGNNETSNAAGNCARNGTGNGYLGNGSTLLPGWKGFGNGSNKMSAISGTVSCHRQRKNGFSYPICGKDSKDCREGDEAFFYGKQKKKKKKKKKKKNAGSDVSEDMANLSDGYQKQRAAEEFLHFMLGDGLELGIDVVRDVLEHFSGDTDKALEMLLNMASTSPGFHVNELPEQECDEEAVQAAPSLLPKEQVSRINPVSTGSFEQSSFDHVLSKLHDNFPSVEFSFLSEVLLASDCSYGDAVQALRDAGMTPVEKKVSTKVDPAEVLQALFKNEPPVEGLSPLEQQSTVLGEPYTVVAGRARSRNPVSDTKPPQPKVNDEYERHRGSANDHWTAMKRYFQEAAAAHGRGDRVLAGVLSEKGQLFKGLAREASQRASETIFHVKNRDIENNITIDLHAQHVREAFRLLKLHLRSLSSILSVHTLTVITGQGSHSASGRARIKPALTQYLLKKRIPWEEPNAGCLVIKMLDVRKANYPAHERSSDDSSDEDQL